MAGRALALLARADAGLELGLPASGPQLREDPSCARGAGDGQCVWTDPLRARALVRTCEQVQLESRVGCVVLISTHLTLTPRGVYQESGERRALT